MTLLSRYWQSHPNLRLTLYSGLVRAALIAVLLLGVPMIMAVVEQWK